MPAQPSRKIALADALFAGLALLALGVVLTTYRDYGITWDEHAHMSYGNRIMRWFGSAFTDDSAIQKGSKTYPGAYDALGAAVRALGANEDRFQIMHLLGGLCGVLGIVGTWKFGRLLGGPWAGFWSAAFIFATPTYWGNSFVNPKDIPFAVGYIWALYFIARVVRSFPSVPMSLWLKCGVAMGAACSVRIAGLLTFCYWGLLLAILSIARARRSRSWQEFGQLLSGVAPRALGAFVVAWAVLVALWPWAHIDPIRRPLQSLRIMSKFQMHLESRVFNGTKYQVFDVPWDYIPRYLAYKLPEIVVVLSVIGLSVGLFRLTRRLRDEEQVRENCLRLLLGMACLLPPAYAIYRGSSLYDGIRHFLFVMPPLCVVAGLTMTQIQHWVQDSKWAKWVELCFWAPVILIGVRHFRVMDHIHPHHYTWFNRFSGGMKAVEGNFDVEYYGASYKQAIEKMDEYLWDTEPSKYLDSIYRVRVCGTSYVVANYLPPNFRIDKEKPQLYAGYTRSNCTKSRKQHPMVTKVERFGITLNAIRDLRKIKAGPKKAKKRKRKKAHAKRSGMQTLDPMRRQPPQVSIEPDEMENPFGECTEKRRAHNE